MQKDFKTIDELVALLESRGVEMVNNNYLKTDICRQCGMLSPTAPTQASDAS